MSMDLIPTVLRTAARPDTQQQLVDACEEARGLILRGTFEALFAGGNTLH
jgi:hypothetical protein